MSTGPNLDESRSVAYNIPEEESDKVREALMAAPPASFTATPASASPALKEAWNSYYRALDEMRVMLESSSMFLNPRYRAKAFHVLMEVQAIAYCMAVAPRLATPRMMTNSGWHDDIFSLGLVCPDWHYGHTYLDGKHSYRLTGHVSDNSLVLIQVTNESLGVEGGKTIGMYDLADMIVEPDGYFSITVGGAQTDGNWIPLDSNSDWNFLYIRTQLKDFGHEGVGEYGVEHISAVTPSYYENEEFNEEEMARRVHRAEMLMRIYIREFTVGIFDFAMAGSGGVNKMSLQPGLTFVGGSSFSRYAQGVFAIEDDEALIVEMPSPDSMYWGFMLGDVWSRALPFSRYQTSLNSAQVTPDSDGRYRFVVSVVDPGVANWLDTTGHNDGEVFFRNYLATEDIVPTLTRVNLADLYSHLPTDVATVSPEVRRAHIAHRRTGFVKLYGE